MSCSVREQNAPLYRQNERLPIVRFSEELWRRKFCVLMWNPPPHNICPASSQQQLPFPAWCAAAVVVAAAVRTLTATGVRLRGGTGRVRGHLSCFLGWKMRRRRWKVHYKRVAGVWIAGVGPPVPPCKMHVNFGPYDEKFKGQLGAISADFSLD